MSTRRRLARTSRWRIRPAMMAMCAAIWALLWGSFSPFILISGALLGWLIGVVFPLPPMFWQGRLSPISATYLVARLIWDLVVSSARLIGYAFQPKVDMKAGIVRVDLASDNDLYQVGVASLTSLVPGTVVVEIVRHPRRLYLHCVGLDENHTAEDIQEMTTGVERRLLKAIGSKKELADFEDALATPSVVPPTDWAAEEADADEEAN